MKTSMYTPMTRTPQPGSTASWTDALAMAGTQVDEAHGDEQPAGRRLESGAKRRGRLKDAEHGRGTREAMVRGRGARTGEHRGCPPTRARAELKGRRYSRYRDADLAIAVSRSTEVSPNVAEHPDEEIVHSHVRSRR